MQNQKMFFLHNDQDLPDWKHLKNTQAWRSDLGKYGIKWNVIMNTRVCRPGRKAFIARAAAELRRGEAPTN